jgi:beta-N-acetylhexosaminidase
MGAELDDWGLPAPPPPRRPRGPGRAQIRRRRLGLGLACIALLALVVLGVLLATGGGGGGPSVAVTPEVAKAVERLSAGEKVDTVLAVGFAGTRAPQLAPDQGGVVIEPANWPGDGAGRSLLAAIHAAGRAPGRVPPLVIGLQEGGQYRAYAELPPPLRELDIGDRGDPALAESSSRQAAAALKKAGFDLNLAPVADVATLDSAIADRSYGDEPELVAQMTAAAIRGCAAAGLACAPSHFPGEGAASGDTGDGPATVGLDPATLRARDLVPFRAAFDAKAPAVVLSHSFYAAYDSVTPASLSPQIATGLLRDELGFEGVAITDDLSAGAIRGGDGAGDASVQALSAGADLLLVSDPGDAAAARASLLKAVGSGQFSQQRLDDAVARVLELKRKAGLLG